MVKGAGSRTALLAAMAAALGIAGTSRFVTQSDGARVTASSLIEHSAAPPSHRRWNRVKPRDTSRRGASSRRTLRLRGISRGRRRHLKARNRRRS